MGIVYETFFLRTTSWGPASPAKFCSTWTPPGLRMCSRKSQLQNSNTICKGRGAMIVTVRTTSRKKLKSHDISPLTLLGNLPKKPNLSYFQLYSSSTSCCHLLVNVGAQISDLRAEALKSQVKHVTASNLAPFTARLL